MSTCAGIWSGLARTRHLAKATGSTGWSRRPESISRHRPSSQALGLGHSNAFQPRPLARMAAVWIIGTPSGKRSAPGDSSERGRARADRLAALGDLDKWNPGSQSSASVLHWTRERQNLGPAADRRPGERRSADQELRPGRGVEEARGGPERKGSEINPLGRGRKRNALKDCQAGAGVANPVAALQGRATVQRGAACRPVTVPGYFALGPSADPGGHLLGPGTCCENGNR